MEELHVEVHRITNCPYTPSLKKLHDILQNIDVDLLQLWARGNPCQVTYLATIVLEALELWPFTIGVLKTMGSVPSFRNATLQQKPVLLETLITNAIDSKSGFDKYAATCVALLSTPSAFAIPANAPVFLMKCLEGAVQSLSSETIRPVYLLLSGVESSCFDILPSDILYSLQTQMIRVLTNLDSDDHLASLLCLAVLAKFSSRLGGKEKPQPNVQSLPDDKSEPEAADRFLPARKFFSSRVPKTLDLVVIKAITACSQSCQLKTYEIVESLKLSREIVDAFDKKERNHWLAGNTRKTNKLREKILRPGIETKVQCEALNFLVAMSAEKLPPQEVTTNLQKYLLTPQTDGLSANAIEMCILLLEDASIRELLESLLVMTRDKRHPCRESLVEVDNALRLISVFTEKIPTSSKLLKAVLQSISNDVPSSMLRQFESQEQESMYLGTLHGHSTIEVCPLSYCGARARLLQSFSMMVLKSALHAPQCGVYFNASTLTLLLEKQSFHCPTQHASMECTQRRPTNIITPKISMFEAFSTPCMDSAGHNWREGLMREMSRDVDCRYEGVIRIVSELCRDLELRCEETEGPLREEQSKSRDLQARLESSERDKAELELEARNNHSAFSALETQRGCLIDQVEATERWSKELGASLDNIRQEFDHAKIEAERTAQAAIESARHQDLVYLATMTGKDEVLEERSLRLASTENHAKALEQEINRMRGLENITAEKLDNSETHVKTLNNAISALECRVEDLQNTLIRTKEQNACNATKISQNDSIIEDLNNSLAAMKEASDQNWSLASSLKEQLQKAEFEISGLRLQHETYISAKDADFERLEQSRRFSSDKWQSELEVARRSAVAASEQFRETIASLQSKITKLRQERKKQAREFAEAQELSSRLMSIMGATKRQISPHGAETRTQRDDRHDLPSSSDADSSDLPAAKPPRFSNPRASSRAPKRIKRHQDPRTPTTCAAKSPKSMTTSKEHCRSTMRVPLANLEAKQGPGPLTQKNPRDGEYHTPKLDGAQELLTENDQAPQKFDSDEESFDGGDIFTSTNQQQFSALPTKMPRHDYDETTTEF